MPRPFAIVLLLFLAFVAPRLVAAQAKPAKPAVTPVQEAAALEFAEAHHPELARLLGRLKESDHPAYEKAVRDIAGTSERLAKFRETDSERYALMVRNWTVESRVRLLTARLTMSDDSTRREELERLLRERQQGRLALLRLDRERAAARLEKLDAQIEELERGGDEAIERDLAKVERAMKASARKRPKPNGDMRPKPAAKKSQGKPTDDAP